MVKVAPSLLSANFTCLKDDIEKIALADDNIKNNLQNKTVRKVIVIPNKIVNIVAN